MTIEDAERDRRHMTDSPTRTEDPRVERTRIAVIEAACELLLVDGPSAITHANVAAAADVSRSTVYNHWPTREALLRAAIESIHDDPPRLDDLTGSLRHDLGVLFEPLTRDLVDDQRAAMIATMMQRVLFDPEVVTIRDEFLLEFTDLVEQVLRTGIDAGALRPDLDIDHAIGSLLGSCLYRRFMSNAEFDARAVDGILDEFVRLHAPR
jgi:AcrR family transcriptional regulator